MKTSRFFRPNSQNRPNGTAARVDALVVDPAEWFDGRGRRFGRAAAGSSVCSHPIADTAIADDFFRATAFAEFYSLAEVDVDTLGCLYRELLTDGRATDCANFR